jgi:hypothetical protein
VPALPMGSSWAQEGENFAVLAPIRRDVKALVHRVALLEGGLLELTEPGRCPKRMSMIYGAHRPRVPDDWRPLRRGIVNSPRSFPFCTLGALSFALPSLVHHR